MKTEHAENVAKFIEMMKGIKNCMLITNPIEAGNLSGRPMGINKIDDDATMWFFTKSSSEKADELRQNYKISIAVVNEKNNNYFMINGSAGLIHNQKKIKELWNPAMKAWFPHGVEESDIVLIKVKPHEVNYWDSSSCTMVVLFNMFKAILTGNEYNEEEYGKLIL